MHLEYALEGDSSYQNSCEFVAALVGLVALMRYCTRNGRQVPRMVSFRGDSITALTWVGNRNYRGEYAFCAATIFALIAAKRGVEIADATHLPKELNTDCDDLSRGRSVRDVLGRDDVDWRTEDCSFVRRVHDLCNPRLFGERCADFELFWSDANNLVLSL